jgi:predicted RNA polymerase sigma factor
VTPTALGDLLRDLAPQVLGAVVRRYRDFDSAEDAVQEALLAAARQWPADGVPEHPQAWLVQVASRRLINIWRADDARRRREETAVSLDPRDVTAAADEPDTGGDDSLRLLFLCGHPALSAPSAIALTLRAVGGLTTAEIAHAFLVPEATMAQRISRAKQRIHASGAAFAMPEPGQWRGRLDSVRHVLYLIFNEGYASSSGDSLVRADLSREAIRLTRMLHRLLPDDTETAGLLALMLLTDARRDARTGPHGELVPLPEQDRARWDGTLIAEGVALISATLRRHAVGPYQLQAAVAAVHDEAARAEDTDWPQILALYGVLERLQDNPMVTLNRAVALAMVDGPAAGLALLDTVEQRLPGHHRVAAVRGHLLEMSGDLPAATAAFTAAMRTTTSTAEQRYLTTHLAELHSRRTP